MRSRKKYFPLSQKGINDAIAYLERYKKQLLAKTQELLEELAQYGIQEADRRFDAAKSPGTDTSHAVITSVTSDGTNVRMNIKITGEDLVFIEFGAGVHFNGHAGEGVHEEQVFTSTVMPVKVSTNLISTDSSFQNTVSANTALMRNGNGRSVSMTVGMSTVRLFTAQKLQCPFTVRGLP